MTRSKMLDNRGQGLTEYIMLVLLIAVVSIGATKTLGSRIRQNIEQASNHINRELTLEN
ncbi:MAG: hypothetical protein NDJ90_12065 [Oligoflexia bacterium]|nr:hypothetical protein [Oligoflexia bacterium]